MSGVNTTDQAPFSPDEAALCRDYAAIVDAAARGGGSSSLNADQLAKLAQAILRLGIDEVLVARDISFMTEYFARDVAVAEASGKLDGTRTLDAIEQDITDETAAVMEKLSGLLGRMRELVGEKLSRRGAEKRLETASFGHHKSELMSSFYFGVKLPAPTKRVSRVLGDFPAGATVMSGVNV